MHVYVPDNYYGHMLENTLLHIYNQSCGFATAVCMACEKAIFPMSEDVLMDHYEYMIMNDSADRSLCESFFFVMCANCRTDMQAKMGRIPSRSKQRTMIESTIKRTTNNDDTTMYDITKTDPNTYANIYVISVENGVEIILLVGKMQKNEDESET